MDVFQYIHHHAITASRERYRVWKIWRDNPKSYWKRAVLHHRLYYVMQYTRMEKVLWQDYLIGEENENTNQ